MMPETVKIESENQRELDVKRPRVLKRTRSPAREIDTINTKLDVPLPLDIMHNQEPNECQAHITTATTSITHARFKIPRELEC